MTEKTEKEIMEFISKNTHKVTHVQGGGILWGIKDMPQFVHILIEFLEKIKKQL